MRNLQKILALVLALVMSLSLMATAGATDFTDGDSITDTFAESVKVLDGLKVFQGYPEGDFRPQGEITRAEVAAIIYRIATGDVGDTQVGIYADYDVFDDVYASEPISGWAAGYINYCANAEYVKGRGNGKFDPAGKVTGYEALAMILRAVGYDKNGEFTGADWQVQTAAIANQRKVTQNINAGMLGQPATREMVAEILCKAILLNKVNYTLAYGYQISTNDQDTIAYDTFQMECLTGVVTGNEIADLKNSSPMAANQTRMVVDGEEEKVLNFATGLDSIGKSVRAYIRPQSGTTVKELVSGETFDTELNHVYDSFAPVSSVGNSTGSENGINSIVGAEHFINYDFVNRWTAAIRITYKMDLKWTEYDARTMRRDNGGHLWPYNTADAYVIGTGELDGENAKDWATQLTSNAKFTYHYEKTILLDDILTNQDYENLHSIFTNADKTNPNSFILGEVYVGTTQVTNDISDDIRWTDFVNTYLVNKDNRAQVESNGRGNRLIIIDNDDDGIAEYVLQTIYTIAKVSSDVKNVDVINQKLYDGSNNDSVNSTTPSNTLVSVSGKELAASEEALNAGDVVIYALIDGNIRAQKAETKTEKVNTVNRAGKTITVVGEEAATYNESAVHTHSNGLTSGVNGMVGNTTYTMYFDLDGNMAAYTEGANGGLVLITNGWNRSTISGPEYAVQAYLDGALQTVNVSTNGARFINSTASINNNAWYNLRNDFGKNDGTAGPINSSKGNDNKITTIIANLDGEVLTPVDQAYLYSQNLRMLDMVGNVIPGQNNVSTSWGDPYVTRNTSGGNAYPAYNVLEPTAVNTPDVAGNRPANTATLNYSNSYEVRSLASTVYYVVYRAHGTDTMTGGRNVVVRQYTSAPSLDTLGGRDAIEDVYAVGAKSVTATGVTYYTAQMVVIEVTGDYSRTSEQVFIPSFPEIGANVKIENVPMIRNGELVTLAVDMEQSRTWDWYYTAGGTTGGNSTNRLQGLYYLDPSDTDPDVYVVQRMSPADIRNSNRYAIGYVRESYFGTGGTATSRYTQIEQLVRPTANTDLGWKTSNSGYFGTNVQNAYNSTPVAPVNSDPYKTANITDTSKFYTYNGTTATESNDYTVLAQYRQDNAGTDVYGLNERLIWAVDAAGNISYTINNNVSQNYGNRNEVLVCYNGSGNIVYAVSFNDNTDGNASSQVVWWNNLPLDADDPTPAGAPTVTFYGKTVTGADSTQPITVNYSAAVAAQAAGNKLSTTGKTYQLYENDVLVTNPQTRLDSIRTTGESYTLSVTNDDGKIYNFTLNVQAQAQAPGEPESTDPARIKIDSPNRTAQTLKVTINDPAQITLAQFESKLKSKVSGGYGNADDEITVKAWTGDTELVRTDRMDHVTKIEITVTNRDKTPFTWTATGTNIDLDSGITGTKMITIEKDTGVKVNTSSTTEFTNSSIDVTGTTNVYVYAQGTVQLKQSVNGAAATALTGTTVTASGVTYTYATVDLNSFSDGDVVKFSSAAITESNYAVTATGDVTSNTAYITKNATLNGKSIVLTAKDNNTVVTVGKDDITVGGTKVPNNYYTVTSVAGTSTTPGTVTIAFTAWSMTGEMVINAKVSTVDTYVAENSAPIAGESRPAYNVAYKDAGIDIKANGNTINITASESALIAYATSADASKVANTALMVNVDPGDHNTYLFAGVTINAPKIAQSVRYKIGTTIESEVLAGTLVARNADKFVDDGVHFYFELIKDANNGTPPASWGSIANKTYSHRIGLQFYSDNAGATKLGGVQYYDVNVTVTP